MVCGGAVGGYAARCKGSICCSRVYQGSHAETVVSPVLYEWRGAHEGLRQDKRNKISMQIEIQSYASAYNQQRAHKKHTHSQSAHSHARTRTHTYRSCSGKCKSHPKRSSPARRQNNVPTRSVSARQTASTLYEQYRYCSHFFGCIILYLVAIRKRPTPHPLTHKMARRALT